MQKVILLMVLLGMHCSAVLAQKQLVINGKVQLTMPAGFQITDKKDTRDSTQFTGSGGKVFLSYQFATDSITDNEIPAYTDDLLKRVKMDSKSYEYIDDGIHLQDGKNIGYIKYSSSKAKGKRFHYTFFISVDQRPLVFEFNCPFRQRSKWDAVADELANSLRTK